MSEGGDDAYSTILLVATYKGRTWVVENANHDLDWETQARSHISKSESRFTWDRSRALLLAHNIQRRVPHSCGVWEVFLKDEKKGKSTDEGKDIHAEEETTESTKPTDVNAGNADIVDIVDKTDKTDKTDKEGKEGGETKCGKRRNGTSYKDAAKASETKKLLDSDEGGDTDTSNVAACRGTGKGDRQSRVNGIRSGPLGRGTAKKPSK